MAKGHRSQIKRARNESNRETRPSAKIILCKNFCSESLPRIRCNPWQRCADSTWNPDI